MKTMSTIISCIFSLSLILVTTQGNANYQVTLKQQYSDAEFLSLGLEKDYKLKPVCKAAENMHTDDCRTSSFLPVENVSRAKPYTTISAICLGPFNKCWPARLYCSFNRFDPTCQWCASINWRDPVCQ